MGMSSKGHPQAADKVRGAGGSSPCRGLGQSPKALCRSIFRERCERPKDARNAALSKTMGFSTVWGCPQRDIPFLGGLEGRNLPGI